MKRVFRWILVGTAGLVAVAAAVLGGGTLYLRGSLPQTEGEATLAALDAPVEAVRHEHSIPTIRAESWHDAYRALGYLHAQDRLWQLETTRRAATGRLSELVGEGTIGLDRFMRTLGFRDLVKAQASHISPETRAALQAYAEGVNAYLDSDPILPPEFQVLRQRPEPWSEADSLAWLRMMALMLSDNWREEVTRARLAERLSEEEVAFFYPDYGEDGATTIEIAGQVARDLPLDELADVLPRALRPRSASNAWVVSGAQTEGGAPILVNDPHLDLQSPGYWYLARIETPEGTRVGATAPGLPFHILGRNDDLAWGLTTTHSDTQDLFIERLDPADEDRYLTPDGPRPFETREERIAVRGLDGPMTIQVRETRHGPVISDTTPAAQDAAGRGHVMALAWTALRADDRTPDAVRMVNEARSVEEALEAMALVHSPQQNLFLADRHGDIAVAAPARVPVRRRGDGTLPVPGWDDSYGWDGLVPVEELPRIVNPPSGRLINANNRLVGADYPHLIAANWPPPERAERIRALLDAAETPLTTGLMRAMLLDTKEPAAEMLLETLLAAAPEEGRGAGAAQRLRGWDGQMDRTRAAPLIFVAWMDFLNRALFQPELGGAFESFARPDPRRLARALDGEGAWCESAARGLPDDGGDVCARVVRRALDDALDSLERRFGGDMDGWRWGDAHRTGLPHAVYSRIPILADVFNPPIGTDGGDETLNRGGARYNAPEDQRYEHVHGPGLRAIHDMSKGPESSLFIIASGQSGNPLSPHYRSLAEAWRDGLYLNLVGEKQAGDRVLRLTPAKL